MFTTYAQRAARATGCVAKIVNELTTVGLVLCILINLGARFFFKRRADKHEKKYHADIPSKPEAA